MCLVFSTSRETRPARKTLSFQWKLVLPNVPIPYVKCLTLLTLFYEVFGYFYHEPAIRLYVMRWLMMSSSFYRFRNPCQHFFIDHSRNTLLSGQRLIATLFDLFKDRSIDDGKGIIFYHRCRKRSWYSSHRSCFCIIIPVISTNRYKKAAWIVDQVSKGQAPPRKKWRNWSFFLTKWNLFSRSQSNNQGSDRRRQWWRGMFFCCFIPSWMSICSPYVWAEPRRNFYRGDRTFRWRRWMDSRMR